MAVILNMIPVDQKQNTPLQNVNNKDSTKNSKSESGFAKALNSETDKNETDADSKLKSNDTTQLMAVMASMVIPVVVNLETADQVVGNTVDVLKGNVGFTQIQLANAIPAVSTAQLTNELSAVPTAALSDAVPVVPQVQLSDAVPVVPQVQLSNAVPVVPQVQLSNAVPVVPQVQLSNAVPVVPQVQLSNAVSVVPQVQLSNAVPVVPQVQLSNEEPVVPQVQLSNEEPVVPQVQLSDEVPIAQQVQLSNEVPVVPQKQISNIVSGDIGLTTLLVQRTGVNTQMGNTQPGELAELQDQTQLQNKPILDQIEVTEVSTKNIEMLTNDSLFSNITPSLRTMDNTNILAKNNNKQVEGKKIVVGQINVEATEVANNFGLAENVDVKTVVAPQVTVAVVDRLSSENVENVEISLSNQTVKNPNIFAGMLNQQGVIFENQPTLAVEQGPSQQVADSYNITSQIVDQARLVAGAKNTEMIIQLKPDHLGELTFKVTVENGIVNASFHSNNAEVRSIIESSLSQLKQDMFNQGLKVDNVGVYAGLGQFFSNGQQSGGYQQPVIKVRNQKAEEDFLDVVEGINSADKALDATGVDYRA